MTTAAWAIHKVNKLRVSASEGDNPALRFSLSKSLASLDLRPTGMPPSSILYIRHLEDPLPGGLLSGDKNRAVWKNAFRRKLDGIYRQAVKPGYGQISNDVEAVFFKDQAELLASLMVDIRKGDTNSKWWWRNRSFSSFYPSAKIRESLITEPQYIPAVISILAERVQAIDVIEQLDVSDTRVLIQGLAKEFGLARLYQELLVAEIAELNQLASAVDKDNRAQNGSGMRSRYQSQSLNSKRDFGHTAVAAHHVPPWATLFDQQIWQSSLSKEQAIFLGMARIVHSRPMTMRNSIFQAEVLRWWEQEVRKKQFVGFAEEDEGCQDVRTDSYEFISQKNDSDKNSYSDNKNQFEELKAPLELDKQKSVTRVLEKKTIDGERIDKKSQAEQYKAICFEENRDILDLEKEELEQEEQDLEKINQLSRNTGGEANETDNVQHIPSKQTVSGSSSGDGDSEPGYEMVDKAGISELSREGELPEEFLEDDEGVNSSFSENYFDTELGGILFVINLIEQLGLPDRFECLKAGSYLSPWALLDVISRALLSDLFSSYYRDPLWRVLAGLDGRKTKLKVAKKFKAPVIYRIPQDWFDFLNIEEGAPVYWGVYQGGLRVWVEECLLIEKTIEKEAYSECIEVVESYGLDTQLHSLNRMRFSQAPLDNRRSLEKVGLNKDLARFLSYMMPFVREYLKAILELKSASPKSICEKLIRLQSRIYTSSSHIDLVSPVNNSNIILRKSGLDQNPGWLPLYGRVLLIHFT